MAMATSGQKKMPSNMTTAYKGMISIFITLFAKAAASTWKCQKSRQDDLKASHVTASHDTIMQKVYLHALSDVSTIRNVDTLLDWSTEH